MQQHARSALKCKEFSQRSQHKWHAKIKYFQVGESFEIRKLLIRKERRRRVGVKEGVNTNWECSAIIHTTRDTLQSLLTIIVEEDYLSNPFV